MAMKYDFDDDDVNHDDSMTIADVTALVNIIQSFFLHFSLNPSNLLILGSLRLREG